MANSQALQASETPLHTTMTAKRIVWMHFAKWMEENHLEVSDLAGITHDAIAEYLACLRVDHCASTYNNRVCVLREIFHILAAKAGIDEYAFGYYSAYSAQDQAPQPR